MWVVSGGHNTDAVEDLLSLRLRGLLLAALLGLMASLCAGQDSAPQNLPSAPQNQPSTPQNQPPAQQNQPPAPPAQPSESSSRDSQEQPQPTQPPVNQPAPKPAQPSSSRQKEPQQKQPAPYQPSGNSGPITLDNSETIFSFLTALNTCGYDLDLTISDATRSHVRAEVQRNLAESQEARAAQAAVCDFYQRHATSDASRNLSQYISLALYVDGAPHFMPRLKEEFLPPDAAQIAGFGTLMEHFYEKAGVHSLWERHRKDYAEAVKRYHEPLAKMVLDTEVYLKQPSAEYLGRTFTIYLDFMGSPNETDARNYGTAYYVVVFPAPNLASGAPAQSGLKMDQIRHTFLHYEMDPLAEKHYSSMQRLKPLLQSVSRAPLEESFKTDISLLVTECLVRAIEIRTTGGKVEEPIRAQAVDDAVKQGYILTRYFYDAVVAFEKDPVGIRGEYGSILENVDLKKEERAAAEVQFAKVASPELVRLSRPEERRMLITAEKRLAAGDPKGAQELAQTALERKIGDQGRALFILAEVAVANKNRDGAQDNFQKAIAASKDPTVVGWSHVYLGRILDMKEEREAALQEYQAALNTAGGLPEIKTAAERGLQRAYEPPTKPQAQQ
ncbi:MAG: DUF4932 domain-containing protein [Candidatus Sulfotelmatobacter sp.]